MIEDNYVCDEKQFEDLKQFDKKYNHFVIAGKNDKGVLLFRCKSLDNNNRCKDYFWRSIYCRAYPKVTDKIRLGGCETFDTCGYKIKVNKDFKNYLKQLKRTLQKLYIVCNSGNFQLRFVLLVVCEVQQEFILFCFEQACAKKMKGHSG